MMDDGSSEYQRGRTSHRWISGLESTLSRIPGLHITGSCYYGASVSDCAKSARETAARVLTGLTARA